MKKMISMLVVVTFAVLGASSAVNAQGIEDTTIQFRSFHDPSVPDPDPGEGFCLSEEVLGRLPPDADVNGVIVAPLGASLWSLASRKSDGKVVNEKIKQVGTGDACAYVDFAALVNPNLSFPEMPFYGEFVLGGQEVTTTGYCTRTGILVTPLGDVFLVGCTMDVLTECS